MQERYPIPDYVLDAYTKCTVKANAKVIQFPRRQFKDAVGNDIRVQQWFDLISKETGLDVKPSDIFQICILNHLTVYEPATCPTCGKILSLYSHKRGVKFCCNRCAQLDPAIQNKIKSTMKAHYGVESALRSPEILAKMKQTNLAKYGVEHVTQANCIKEKSKQTCLKKYGVENPYQAETIKKKIKQTLINHYGIDSPIKNEKIHNKIKQTLVDRYGVDHQSKSKEVRAKIAATNRERYGADCALQNPKIIEKAKTTAKIKHYPVFVKLVKAKNISVLSDIEAYVSSKVLKFKCNTCGYLWTRDLQKMPLANGTRSIYCKKCCTQASMAEKELMLFIKSIYSGEVIENTKSIIKPYELDIYLPEKKLAIEFNSTYWNSFKPSKYHQNKTFLCKEQDIRLIHVFEHEWTFSKNKVMQHIKSALDIFEVSIYARQCQVKAISSNEYRVFLDINHLQGAINSSIRLGLFYKDELVSVIGFGKSRFKKGELELHRYCVKAGYQVVGGFSKLLKHSKQTDFVSYVDLSHFTGKGYEKLGFVPIAITSPSYVYVKNDEIKSRMQCQKHKLSTFLSAYYDDLSESDNMRLNGWYKVYDCGNLKLKYTLPRI